MDVSTPSAAFLVGRVVRSAHVTRSTSLQRRWPTSCAVGDNSRAVEELASLTLSDFPVGRLHVGPPRYERYDPDDALRTHGTCWGWAQAHTMSHGSLPPRYERYDPDDALRTHGTCWGWAQAHVM